MVRTSVDDEALDVAAILRAPLAVQAQHLSRWGIGRVGLLMLMSGCEARCFFCANEGTMSPPPEMITRWGPVEAHLDGNTRAALSTLCIGGSEPVTHPNFLDAVRLARDRGFSEVEVMTSGFRLALDGVAATWAAAGVSAVAVPMYAAEPEVHDAITGLPSWHRLVRGIDAARAAGIAVHVHTLALNRNLSQIGPLSRFVADRWGLRLTVAPARGKPGRFDYAAEAPEWDALGAALASLQVSLVGMPGCLAPELPQGGARVIQIYFRGQATAHPEPTCGACPLRPTCPGIVLEAARLGRFAGLGPHRLEAH